MIREGMSEAEDFFEQLSRSKYEVVPSQPDIRGWWVMDLARSKIGNVEDLIFDPESRKVHGLVLNLADNDFGWRSRYVLIPIEEVDLHENEAMVVPPRLSSEMLQLLPNCPKGVFDRSVWEETTRILNVALADRDQHTSQGKEMVLDNGLETFKDGELEIKIYKEKLMTEKEPFEIYIDGEMLTVIPQDETYIVYKGMSKLGDIMPHQDDEGLVWVTGDLIPLDYLAQIGEQIEVSRPR
ncbi:PRC-barrel domain-containing protein [Arcticibacter sp.]|jgi:hypothetical protein|uniref:PRC-barrel domain-containing protein n=1 Tax=Arcticibacter sp. TaxID=1872630 RepID=UPI00388DFA0E